MKQQTATEAPAVVAPEATLVARKPFSLRIGAPVHAALNEAVIHARAGFIFSEGPFELLPNGWAFFDMHQGNPVEHLVQSAAQTIEASAAKEEKERQEAIRQEARRLVEEEKRAELEMQKVKIKAEHEKAVRALEAATEAEVARLNAAAVAAVAGK